MLFTVLNSTIALDVKVVWSKSAGTVWGEGLTFCSVFHSFRKLTSSSGLLEQVSYIHCGTSCAFFSFLSLSTDCSPVQQIWGSLSCFLMLELRWNKRWAGAHRPFSMYIRLLLQLIPHAVASDCLKHSAMFSAHCCCTGSSVRDTRGIYVCLLYFSFFQSHCLQLLHLWPKPLYTDDLGLASGKMKLSVCMLGELVSRRSFTVWNCVTQCVSALIIVQLWISNC